MSNEDEDLKAIQTTRVRQSMRSKSHSFSRRNYDEAQTEKAIRGEAEVTREAAKTTIEIRMHRGTREDSFLTLEVLEATPAAILDYLQRHYQKEFRLEDLRLELYARGEPRKDWDYIYVVECAEGVLAFTNRKIDLN